MFQTINDAFNATNSFITANRNGAVIDLIAFNDDGTNTDVKIEGDTDANLFYTDASADAIGIGTNAPTQWLDLKAGTTARAPLRVPSGTNLTTPVAGVLEYDGAQPYWTNDTTSGRGRLLAVQEYRMTANGSASGSATITDFFPASSSLSLAASSIYYFEADCYFTKTTAGTMLFTPLSQLLFNARVLSLQELQGKN